MMRATLARYLFDIHCLLRNQHRQRGATPGIYLEEDLEDIAHARYLHTERRTRKAPYGGVYFSGLAPETDLFVYDGPQFLHIEAKDVSKGVGRAVPTEFWARAFDLHLGRACATWADSPREHYPVLVVGSTSTDHLRAACLRWSICLVEPSLIPLPALALMGGHVDECFRRAGCTADDLRWATLAFNSRYPRHDGGILVPFGRLRTRASVDALLRFQRIATPLTERFFGRGDLGVLDDVLLPAPALGPEPVSEPIAPSGGDTNLWI